MTPSARMNPLNRLINDIIGLQRRGAILAACGARISAAAPQVCTLIHYAPYFRMLPHKMQGYR